MTRGVPTHSACATGELLHAYAATPVVRAALKLAPMLLLRPGELRFAEWPEIDWTKRFGPCPRRA